MQSSGHLGWSAVRGTRANLSPGVAQQQQREFLLWMGEVARNFQQSLTHILLVKASDSQALGQWGGQSPLPLTLLLSTAEDEGSKCLPNGDPDSDSGMKEGMGFAGSRDLGLSPTSAHLGSLGWVRTQPPWTSVSPFATGGSCHLWAVSKAREHGGQAAGPVLGPGQHIL